MSKILKLHQRTYKQKRNILRPKTKELEPQDVEMISIEELQDPVRFEPKPVMPKLSPDLNAKYPNRNLWIIAIVIAVATLILGYTIIHSVNKAYVSDDIQVFGLNKVQWN